MFRRKDGVSASIDTLIGQNTCVHGDLEFSGGLHLDGCVLGNVHAPVDSGSTLSVSEHGRIEGSVEVPSVVLNGVVMGDIRAREKVVLGARARVQGSVHYGTIETAPGAEISGRLVPGGQPAEEWRDPAAPEAGPP